VKYNKRFDGNAILTLEIINPDLNIIAPGMEKISMR
jgi:hypothetical protein